MGCVSLTSNPAPAPAPSSQSPPILLDTSLRSTHWKRPLLRLGDSTIEAFVTLEIHAFIQLFIPSKQSWVLIDILSQESKYWAELETR